MSAIHHGFQVLKQNTTKREIVAAACVAVAKLRGTRCSKIAQKKARQSCVTNLEMSAQHKKCRGGKGRSKHLSLSLHNMTKRRREEPLRSQPNNSNTDASPAAAKEAALTESPSARRTSMDTSMYCWRRQKHCVGSK